MPKQYKGAIFFPILNIPGLPFNKDADLLDIGFILVLV